jgi:hypothetical protein
VSDLKYPRNTFPNEIHDEIQLFFSRSENYCYGIRKIELVDLKKKLGIVHFYQLESGSKIKLYKLGVIPPFITDVVEFVSIDDLDMIDEKWGHRRIK